MYPIFDNPSVSVFTLREDIPTVFKRPMTHQHCSAVIDNLTAQKATKVVSRWLV